LPTGTIVGGCGGGVGWRRRPLRRPTDEKHLGTAVRWPGSAARRLESNCNGASVQCKVCFAHWHVQIPFRGRNHTTHCREVLSKKYLNMLFGTRQVSQEAFWGTCDHSLDHIHGYKTCAIEYDSWKRSISRFSIAHEATSRLPAGFGHFPIAGPPIFVPPPNGGLIPRPQWAEAMCTTPPVGAAHARKEVSACRRGVAREERRARGGLCQRHHQRLRNEAMVVAQTREGGGWP